MSAHYTINCKSRMSKGMELHGNILTGDTYGARDFIKTHWDGKWDASRKCWIVDAQKVITTIQEQTWGFAKVLSLSTEINPTPSRDGFKVRGGVDGWCDKCHSYCYGDCQS
jgi:hypothetical protein